MFGYFRSENGLGSAARQNMRAARAAGLPVTAYNVPCLGFADNLVPEFALHTGTPKQDIVLMHVNADTAKLIRTIYDPRVFQSRHKIGYWAWELSAMPIEWVGAYDEIDEVWAPSQFSAAAFAQRTRKPVTVMSHPVEVPAPPPDIAALRRRFKIAEDRFVFLTAFDLNSYIARKNPFAAVQAFSRAFAPGKSSPLLVVKMHGEYHRDARFVKLQDLIAKNPNIVVIDSVLDAQSVSDLQWCCDAFVSLHRSEGFGLWIAECMARGKPCVVTGYSGNMDFTTSENSVLIGFSMVNVNRGEYPFGEGQSWAEPSADEAVAAMRALVDDAALASKIGKAARQTMQRKFC